MRSNQELRRLMRALRQAQEISEHELYKDDAWWKQEKERLEREVDRELFHAGHPNTPSAGDDEA